MNDAPIARVSDDQRKTMHDSTQIVSCFWCECAHAGAHPLSVCPSCVDRYAALRLLKMRGSFPLNEGAIDDALTRTSPGNYALGYMDGDAFSVFYVGRSDSDVRGRLHEWVGVPSRDERYAAYAKAPWATSPLRGLPAGDPTWGHEGNPSTPYTHFAYSYSLSAADAFGEELRNFDDFGGRSWLDNPSEPALAAG